jgi:DNA-binding CsgD family transcriptional regulator
MDYFSHPAKRMAACGADMAEQDVSDQVQRSIAGLYDAAFQLPLLTFQDAAFDRLKAMLPFDSAMWLTGVHETNLVHDVRFYCRAPIDIGRYVAHFAELDHMRNRAVAEPGVPFRIEDAMPIEAYRAGPQYLHAGRDGGIEYAMGTVLADPITQLSEYLVLYRGEREFPFTDKERAVAQVMVPHMVAAWRHRQLIGMMKAAAGFDDIAGHAGRAHAIVDGQAMVRATIGNFGDLLAQAIPGWVGPTLPPEVMRLVDLGTNFGVFNGLEIAIAPMGDRYTVVITPEMQPNPLTAAELRAARLYAQGKSQKDIASDLGISAHTVRNQVSSAYRKLDVHSKLGLAEAIKQRA